jgi:hypothetical protein
MAIKVQLFSSCALSRCRWTTEARPAGRKRCLRNFASARLSVMMGFKFFCPFHQEVPCIGRFPVNKKSHPN